MDALVTAGGVPSPKDPLYAYTRGGAKALIPVAGKPMIQWVLDALCGSAAVEHITIIGLAELGSLTCPKPLTLIPGRQGMLANILAGVHEITQRNPTAEKVLLAASDIPAVASGMVDWLADIVEKSDADVFYNVIQRPVMERRYPGSRRTYIHLKGMEICGGDLNALRVDMVQNLSGLWQDLIATRKNPVRQAAILGPGLLLRILTRQATLDDSVQRIGQRLGIKGKALICPYAELGMDVDKPFQLAIMQKDLAGRG